MHPFYSTLYTSKSTQDEDSKKQIRIGHAVIKRINWVLDDNHDQEQEQEEPVLEKDWVEFFLDWMQ